MLLNKYNALVIRSDAVSADTDPYRQMGHRRPWRRREGTALWLDTLLENSVSEAYLNSIQEVLNGTKTPEGAVEAVRTAALAAKTRMEQ